MRDDVPPLRSRRLLVELRRSLLQACERADFRLVHYSVMDNHVHWIVEVDDEKALARGMKSLGARLARAVNRVFARCGAVVAGRYHAVVLRSPTQVYRALRYVLLNARHHAKRVSQQLQVDPACSGRWFVHWREAPTVPDPIGGAREVARPQTWLLRTGRQRCGPIGLLDVAG